jgi:hypothetical protein
VVISERLEAMAERGYSMIVGTVDDDGAPRATRGWGVKVVDERARRVRFTMSADDEIAVGNLEGRLVALTGADVRSLQAMQMKGAVVAIGVPDDDDLQRMTAHTENFLAAVEEIDGIPPDLLKRNLPLTVVTVDVVVDELYDQSPGPSAGAAIRGGGQ